MRSSFTQKSLEIFPNLQVCEKPISKEGIINKIKRGSQAEEEFNGPSLKMPVKFNVLVVDDVKVNRELIKTFLELLNISGDTYEASNGLEAIKKINGHAIDLVFMDIQMPRMDGIEATKKIKKMNGNFKRPYIIALTAEAFEQQKLLALEAGMDNFLVKPVTLKSFSNIIQEVKNQFK